ncbi:MAG: multidrug effflux MFS transporter [Hyphomicrobium sp.]|uniref:multidrug effflux MFS transporter n=1 Tax=Hyphomicrobium sp. TaxID=82 RepID=UPI00132BE628|nr:multidrug effflux MFS transporter [Hyphomicrobium sp.]KAB2941523.1 MAG: multidrug effflux MFS transporter [Hyphomicrobium sp.]MBZ0211328.1 multidrug effflux MFS transporter [Hyphomicrobium sp.]
MNAPERDRRFIARSAAAMPADRMSIGEFIALTAVMMSLTAMAVDVMLPALPQIGEALGVADPNDRQNVVIVYMLGFSLGQLAYGRLSDKYGRKPVLMVGMAIFIVGSLAASLASGFALLLCARAVQGLGAAAPRVLAIAIVRDRFAGRQMARVMSFAMAVFIIIPVLAPGMGQGVLAFGTWRHVFDLLLVAGVLVALWAAVRLPETAHVGREGPLPLGRSIRLALATRQTIGYAVAGGLVFGCVLAYVASAQQLFVDVFGLGAAFPLAFGAIALTIGAASLTNAQLVEQLGMRRVSHFSLAGFIVLSLALVLAAQLGWANVARFIGLMAVLFFLFGLIAPNFNALAMEPQGDNAGMASSVVGFVSTAAGALVGGIIGHMFDGTVLPLALGFLCLSAAAFAVVLWVEGPRGLFHPGR